MKGRGTLILCYHRIADPAEDPFGLCVSPDNFSAHLDELLRRREPSTLDDLSAPSRRPRVVVTFDDGYWDNLANALPIAESKGVPITVFVTSGLLGGHTGFWWDRLAALLRSRPPEVPRVLPGDRRTDCPHPPRHLWLRHRPERGAEASASPSGPRHRSCPRDHLRPVVRRIGRSSRRSRLDTGRAPPSRRGWSGDHWCPHGRSCPTAGAAEGGADRHHHRFETRSRAIPRTEGLPLRVSLRA